MTVDTKTTKTRVRDNGEGMIRERKDGAYEARLRIGGGERRSFYGKTKKEVREKLNAARRDYEAGRLAKDPAKKVGQFLDEWLASRKRSIAPSTYDNYALNITRMRPHLGQLHLTALRHTHIEQCYESLRADLSETSVHQAHRVLRIALHHAVKCRYIAYNPLDLVATPRPPHKEMRTLDADQVEALLLATRTHRLHALWVVLVTTGLRIGEATALTWGDLELVTSRLSVRRHAHWQNGHGMVIGPTKTPESRRVIDLPARTVDTLSRHRIRQMEERLAAGPAWQENSLVFCTEFGQVIEPSWARRLLSRALAAAGLPDVRIHDLRHTFATLALQAGVSIKAVQNALGHSTATLTLDTYAHVTPDMRKETATAMDQLFPAARDAS